MALPIIKALNKNTMNNNEPNKIVSRLYKQFKKLNEVTDAEKYDYVAKEKLIIELKAITIVVGAVSVMSKNSILKLSAMQSSFRFMQLHSFLIYLSIACEDLKL